MSKQTIFDRRVLVAAGFAVGLGFSQTALADNPTASDDLEVQVELAAGLTLVCGTLNFGTINVELGVRNSTNEVKVDADGEASLIGVGTGNAALGGGSAAATCTITGINSADNTTINASVSENATVSETSSLVSLSGAASGDGGPTSAYSGTLLVALDLYDADKALLDEGWSGSEEVYTGTGETESTFIIGGVLNIPADDFEADNMGKYEASVTIVVEEEDA